MKTAILLATGAVFALGLPAITANEAQADGWKKKRDHAKQHRRYRDDRRDYRYRDYDRAPIRVTRPPGTSHYIYQDYPEWAARAFQRPQDR
jgi:hypothetical protein